MTTASVNPGFVRTNLMTIPLPMWLQRLLVIPVLRLAGMLEPWEGAQTTLHALLAPEVEQQSGAYYSQIARYKDKASRAGGWPLRSPNPVAHDDDTKQPLSLVRISETAGVQSGKLEKLLDPARQNDKCTLCADDRKNQPMLGMTIMRNVKASGDGTWEGGDILDPNNGKVYRVRLKPIEGGKALEVRGYIGPFFRNQRWTRVE